MKKIGFLLLFLSVASGFSQTKYVTISGVIRRAPMSVGDTVIVEKAEVSLSINDTLKLMTLSDENGRYEFNVKSFKGNGSLSCQATKRSMVKGRSNPCIFPTRDERTLDLNKPNGATYTADFILREGCCLPRAPELLFKANSLVYETDSLITHDQPVMTEYYLLQLLNENPTLVIELNAHCDSKEKNKKELSLKRAALVQQALIKKGIEAGRVKIKGQGDLYPVMSENIVKAAKSSQERYALRAKNQRVEIRVLSFDDGVKEKPAQTKKITDEDEE